MSEAMGRTQKQGTQAPRLLVVSSEAFCPSENGGRLGPRQALKMLWAEGREGGVCLGRDSSQSSRGPIRACCPHLGGPKPEGAAHLRELILMNPVASPGS